jgi:hypothetical protein
MNERIKQLKESAQPEIDWAARYHVELNNGEKEKWMNEWFEKFAELIVRECLDIVNRHEYSYHEADPLWETAQLIKERFGVEE